MGSSIRFFRFPRGGVLVVTGSLAFCAALQIHAQQGQTRVLTGQAAFTDDTREHPGVRRHLTVADLPQPMPDTSIDNGAQRVPRPAGAMPQAPAGFGVQIYAEGGFQEPRLIRTAPNGDAFLAVSRAGFDGHAFAAGHGSSNTVWRVTCTGSGAGTNGR